MSGRHSFLRRGFHALNPSGLDDSARKLLRRAHRMMENGDHTNSARIFERLAHQLEDRGVHRHTPNLYLQAARGNLLAGNAQQASALLIHGLSIFEKDRRWEALARASRRVLDELQRFGHPEIAGDISKWLAATLPEPLDHYTQPRKLRGSLPLSCPGCGGTLLPDEVAFVDELKVECPYCGRIIRGEK